MQDALLDTHRVLAATRDQELELMMENNSTMLPGFLNLSTADHVDHLRTLAPSNRTHYVDRTTTIARKHPFREAVLRILGPEPDTSTYYGRLSAAGLMTANADRAAFGGRPQRGTPVELQPPPPGVDPGAYFDLLRSRRKGLRSRIMEIDAANNNTSVVLELEWRGWRLLFPGDAELRSWQTMHQQGLLQPVHLIKVAHHGSHNGTLEEVFDSVFPANGHDTRERHAIVSTHPDSWTSVPDKPTLQFYRERGTLHDTRDVAPGGFVEVVLEG